MREAEQRESTPLQTPPEVLLRMRENYGQKERMDVPGLLVDIELLDKMGVTGNEVISGKILKPLGKDPRLESAVADGYREASLQGDQAALTKYTRLAEVLGIDVKEAEQPEIPYYNQPWQEIFGPAEEIGAGLSGHVYRPEQHSDVVIKVFDKRPEYFQQELGILKKLQGLPHVVKLLGHGGPPYFSPRQQYLVKEFIEGENLAEYFIWDPSTFPLKAGETPSVKYEDHKKLAAWLVSSMEALGQIHKKGILVSDFKFADYLWDPQKGKTVLIDFANAVDMNDPMQEYRGKSPEHDIDALLAIFFYKTLFGQQFGMTIEQNGATWPPRNPGESFLETTRLFKAKAQELRATSSLIKIIELLEDPVKWDPSPKRHPAQEYAQALKDHFKEVGIDISQIPTENRGAAAETPLTPERQTLEQTATQQAQALAQQTGSPITEADLERYGQWKKSKEGQG